MQIEGNMLQNLDYKNYKPFKNSSTENEVSNTNSNEKNSNYIDGQKNKSGLYIADISTFVSGLVKDYRDGNITRSEFYEKMSDYSNKHISYDTPEADKKKILQNINMFAKLVNNSETAAQKKNAVQEDLNHEGLQNADILRSHKDALNTIDEWTDSFAKNMNINAKQVTVSDIGALTYNNTVSASPYNAFKPVLQNTSYFLDIQL